MADELLQIRSFRVVFDMERRIHRIDRFRVPMPYGLPLRSVGYAAAAFLAIVVLQRLPIVGGILGSLDTPIRLVLLPVGASILLSRLRIDGRSAHAAACAWLRFTLASTRYVAFRPAPRAKEALFGEVTLALPSAERRKARRPIGAPAVASGDQMALTGHEQLVMW